MQVFSIIALSAVVICSAAAIFCLMVLDSIEEQNKDLNLEELIKLSTKKETQN